MNEIKDKDEGCMTVCACQLFISWLKLVHGDFRYRRNWTLVSEPQASSYFEQFVSSPYSLSNVSPIKTRIKKLQLNSEYVETTSENSSKLSRAREASCR